MRKLHFVYVSPADHTPNPAFTEKLRRLGLHVEKVFYDNMNDGAGLELHDKVDVVEVIKIPEVSSAIELNNYTTWHTTVRDSLNDNIRGGISDNDITQDVWLASSDVFGSSMPVSGLLGLANATVCTINPRTFSSTNIERNVRSPLVNTAVHEVAHSFGLASYFGINNHYPVPGMSIIGSNSDSGGGDSQYKQNVEFARMTPSEVAHLKAQGDMANSYRNYIMGAETLTGLNTITLN